MTAITRSVAQPTPFDFEAHPVRIVVIDGEPWFVAADVCRALGYKNPRDAVATHLDPDEGGIAICDTPLKNQHGTYGTTKQQLAIISESGMYTLVLRSHKPAARKFAKWVTREVLPEIRKTGSYGETPAPCIDELLDMPYNPDEQLPFPDSVEEAIRLKAYSLSLEAHDLIYAHLRRRVVHECAEGYPNRAINEEKALRVANRGDIGHALTYSYYTELASLGLFADMAGKLAADMQQQLLAINKKIGSHYQPKPAAIGHMKPT